MFFFLCPLCTPLHPSSVTVAHSFTAFPRTCHSFLTVRYFSLLWASLFSHNLCPPPTLTMAEICVCKYTYEKFGPSWFYSMPPCESGGFCWLFFPKMVLPELYNDGFWLLNESLSRAWMAHSKFIYYKGNMSKNLLRCEIFCNKWNTQISRIQKQAYSVCTHNLCCRPLLLYFYEPFVSTFPSFLPPFSSLPSFSPSLRFPNDFLAFHFFPCPNPATEARMQLKSLFCLNRIVFTLDPLLHHLGQVDEFRCLILS